MSSAGRVDKRVVTQDDNTIDNGNDGRVLVTDTAVTLVGRALVTDAVVARVSRALVTYTAVTLVGRLSFAVVILFGVS